MALWQQLVNDEELSISSPDTDLSVKGFYSICLMIFQMM